jgi:hypothetical protein
MISLAGGAHRPGSARWKRQGKSVAIASLKVKGGVLAFTTTPDPTTKNFWRIHSVPRFNQCILAFAIE